MKFDIVHHIAIIGRDYDKMRNFYVNKLGFEQLDEHIRPEKKGHSFQCPKGKSCFGNFYQGRCTNQTPNAQSRAYGSPPPGLSS